jgi:hypothetical protein
MRTEFFWLLQSTLRGWNSIRKSREEQGEPERL